MKKNFLKNYLGEQGYLIVTLAISLPLLIGFTGLAVDVGNVYSHKTRLQNVADSAAYAGAKSMGKNSDESAAKEDSDEMVKNNIDSTGKGTTNYDRLVKKQFRYYESDTMKCYGVKLEEKVPLYFAGVFSERFKSMNITAEGYAALTGGGDNEIFDSLFTFADDFQSTNNTQNPDNYTVTQHKEAVSTYDGKIRALNEDAMNDATSHLRGEMLFTTYAFEMTDANGNAIETSVAAALENDSNSSNRKAINTMYTDTSYVIDDFLKTAIVPKMTDTQNTVIKDNQNDQNANSSTLNALVDKDAIYYNISNVNIDISSPITSKKEQDSGVKNDNTNEDLNKGGEPLYIICDNEYISSINLKVEADMRTGRPVILVYTGKGSVYVNCQSDIFCGIIYAPYGTAYVNDNRHSFYGSVVAKEIILQTQGYYYQRNYTVSGGAGSDANVSLCAKPEGFSWDDDDDDDDDDDE